MLLPSGDGLGPGTVRQINLFFLKLLLSWSFVGAPGNDANRAVLERSAGLAQCCTRRETQSPCSLRASVLAAQPCPGDYFLCLPCPAVSVLLGSTVFSACVAHTVQMEACSPSLHLGCNVKHSCKWYLFIFHGVSSQHQMPARFLTSLCLRLNVLCDFDHSPSVFV